MTENLTTTKWVVGGKRAFGTQAAAEAVAGKVFAETGVIVAVEAKAVPLGKKARYAAFAAAYDKAAFAGRLAGANVRPRPMVVFEADALGQPKDGGRSFYEFEGLCGFAWVDVYPGNSSFARWLVKNKLASTKHYGGGGVSIWISAFNQSVDRKEACAQAMAKVLVSELGVKAYAGSRLD